MAVNSPLPESLHIRYQKYKATTAIVIRWLRTRADTKPLPADDDEASRLPVQEILRFAQTLSKRRILPPRKIQNAFKCALLNRRHLTNFYETLPEQSKLSEAATKRHKFFNDTLAEAYNLLVMGANDISEQARQSKTQLPTSQSQHSAESSTNIFEVLSTLIEQEPDIEDSEEFLPEHDLESSQPSVINDDPMEDIIEIYAYISEMEESVSTITNIWRLAGNGSIPVVFAGWLTSSAFQMIRHFSFAYGKRIGHHQGLLDRYVYREKTDQHSQTKLRYPENIPEENSIDRPFREFTNRYGFVWPWEELLRFRGKPDVKSVPGTSRGKIETFFHSPKKQEEIVHSFQMPRVPLHETTYSEQECDITSKLIDLYDQRYKQDKENALSVIRSVRDLTPVDDMIFMQKTYVVPLHWDIKDTLDNPHLPMLTSTAVGFHLLFESSRAFIWSDGKETPNRINCAIQGMQLAREIHTALKELTTCALQKTMCGTIDAPRLTALYGHEAFTKTFSTRKMPFDLYDQSPWVASSYMSAILGHAQYFGLDLFNESSLVGHTLHLYNMIQQLGMKCPKVPVFEHLCDLFSTQLFQGSRERPRKKFYESLELFLGGKIKSTSNHTTMVEPRRRPLRKESNSLPFPEKRRFFPADISMFAHQNLFGHRGGEAFTAKVASDGKFHRYNKEYKVNETIEKLFKSHSTTELLSKIRKLTEPEFTGAFPLAYLNCFKVYQLCLEIFADIAAKYCAPGGIPMETRDMLFAHDPFDHVMSGLLLHRFVTADVAHRSEKRKTWIDPMDHSGLVMMMDSLVKCSSRYQLEDFQWKNL